MAALSTGKELLTGIRYSSRFSYSLREMAAEMPRAAAARAAQSTQPAAMPAGSGPKQP